jgi:arylsulfatase A-like enzyme
LLILSGCGGEDRSVVIDRVHDLVAMIDEAEPAEGSPYISRPMAEIQAIDNRDGMAYLRATPGAPLVFRNLYARGKTVLEFGCGVAYLTKMTAPSTKVRFRIEAGTEEPLDKVFEVTLSPADLPSENRYLPFVKELAEGGEAEWTLRFSCDAVDSSTKPEWCGWISPRLVSEGRTVDLDRHPVDRRVVKTDLVSASGDAEVVGETPVRIVSLNAWKDNPILGGNRRALRVCASSRIRYSVSLGQDHYLEFSAGMDTEEGWSRPGDGMTFAVEVEGSRVWSRHLDPHNVPDHRGWQHEVVDLGPWAGRTVNLDLVTEPGDDAMNDVGGWCQATVFQRSTVPRLSSGEAPTVLLVVAETLRADFVGAYGSDKGLTPRLDAMAEKSVFFSDVRSVSSWTWPSVASILTGLYPNSHGIKNMEHCFLVDHIETLAERFADKGYATGAFISNMLISSDNNFQQGFETFVLTPYATARALNDRVRSWLDNTQGQARFAYIHYYDPHSPYKPPVKFNPSGNHEEMEFFGRQIRDKLYKMNRAGRVNRVAVQRFLDVYKAYYGAEIAYLDTAFGELMETVEQRGLLEDCIIMFTADHGEEFLEHGAMDHGHNLYDVTLKVPLWISGYGKAAMEPRVIPYQVETRDIYFTLCELAGISLPRSRSFGKSLLQGGPDCLFSQTLIGREPEIKGYTEIQAVIQGQWKLIHAPESDRTLLYDLEADPGEKRDKSGERTARRDTMFGLLKAWEKSTKALAPDSRIGDAEEMEARLKALGYTGR